MKKPFGLFRSTFETFRSVSDDPLVFLAPALTWAIITTAIVVLYCLATVPDGLNMPLGTVLAMFNDTPTQFFIHLGPTFAGGTVLGLCVMQWKLLGREDNNPFYGSREWPRYLFCNAVILIIAVAALILMIVAAVLAYAPLPHTRPYRVMMGTTVLFLSIGIYIFFYARLCMVLPAAARGERLTFMQAFRMTKGHTLKLMAGLLLTAAAPLFVFILLWYFATISRLGSDQTPGMIIWEILRNFEAISIYGFSGLFMAIAYEALRSPAADELAKQFE